MKHIFWHVILPIAIIAGANALDWKSTSDSIHAGNIERSSAWMIGKRPSNLKITLAGIANFTVESHAYFDSECHCKLKWPMRAFVAYSEFNHVQLYFHNEAISKRNTVTPKTPIYTLR